MKIIQADIQDFDDYLKTSQGKKETKNMLDVTSKIAKAFPKSKIKSMDIDEYVLGKNKNTFCHKLEYLKGSTSSIKGSNSFKFGIFFSDDNHKYRIKKCYPQIETKAFEIIKDEIYDLIDMADFNTLTQQQKQRFYKIKLEPMVKSKILSVYNAKDHLPINSDKDIKTFLSWFGVNPAKGTKFLDLQDLLIQQKNKDKIMANWSLVEFSRFLYHKKNTQQALAEMQLDEVNNFKSDEISKKDLKLFTDDATKAPKKIIRDETTSYVRDPRVVAKAIENANEQCELARTHKSFIKNNGSIYLEGHHLIPMRFANEIYNKCKRNIDITANVVALCSNCHNKIHYGKYRQNLVKKLYNLRNPKLQSNGINIKIDDILSMYD